MHRLKVKLLHPKAKLPVRATAGSVGYDLFACLEEKMIVEPGQTVSIPTGISIELERGYGGFVFARSSLGVHYGINPANCVGVIDWDYRGELLIFLRNYGQEAYSIEPGDRIAQLVILPVATPDLEICSELESTQRGTGRFGSTGK